MTEKNVNFMNMAIILILSRSTLNNKDHLWKINIWGSLELLPHSERDKRLKKRREKKETGKK